MLNHLRRLFGKESSGRIASVSRKRLHLEHLQERIVPSHSPVGLHGHVLAIHGTKHHDTVTVSQQGGKLNVNFDGKAFGFAASKIQSMTFDGGDGKDTFINKSHIKALAFVHAGDTIVGANTEDLSVQFQAPGGLGQQANGCAELMVQGSSLTALKLKVEHGPASQTLSVLLDGTQIGQATTDAKGNVRVTLTSFASPVTVGPQSSLVVQDAQGNTILSGTVALPTGSVAEARDLGVRLQGTDGSQGEPAQGVNAEREVQRRADREVQRSGSRYQTPCRVDNGIATPGFASSLARLILSPFFLPFVAVSPP